MEELQEVDVHANAEAMISIRDILLFYKAMQMELDDSYLLHVVTHKGMVPAWSLRNIKQTSRCWQEGTSVTVLVQNVERCADDDDSDIVELQLTREIFED